MQIQRATPINELLAKIIFLLVPTAFIGYFVINGINEYFTVLNNNAVTQCMYFSIGMLIASLFYAFRFRFLPTFIILCIGLYSVYKGLDKYAVGEFDAFFITMQFRVNAFLFIIGWLNGWGFTRLRYWAVFIAGAALTGSIILIAKSNTYSVYTLLRTFTPSLLYSVYIIYTAEQIYNYKDKSKKFWWFLSRRLSAFILLSLLLFGGVVYLMRKEIKETVANYGGGGQQGENSMLKKNNDGTFDLKNYSRLRSSLGRSNELLFCAHINNYFPGTEVPNPLYLTAFYYTKFDTLTETFERDTTIPNNDLFEPNPSALPMFFTKTDSSVLRPSQKDKLKRTIDVEIYCKALSPSTYLAPSTGYFVQPITIEKDFRDEFKTAFRAKSYISELNSAYFIYNAQNPELKKFQQQRFDILRTAGSYDGMDKKFMSYYTYMPSDTKFRNISDLAHKVAGKPQTTIDKILAIRDYFLAKDENGEQIYTYTDNPGIPDIPSASKLMYFLFENHKGYCAYYAGATLFMLRSLGIPSRIAVGFLTVDRSDKNKGWYWYYADQAHAWVQVYFPGYGWIDFDTTVGNNDAQESPKPDGTPPMQPPRAWLAVDGIIEGNDTGKKQLQLNVKHIIFHDKEYKVTGTQSMTMDMKIASIYRDSVAVPLSNVQKGDEATVVSYAEALKLMSEIPGETTPALLKRMVNPTPADEVYLKRKDTKKPEEKPATQRQERSVSPQQILLDVLIALFAIIVLVLFTPYIVWRYYLLRHKISNRNDRPYWAYRAASFYLQQLGIYRHDKTPMQYAREVVDPMFGTDFTRFMNIYLKRKYANISLNEAETEYAGQFLLPFVKKIKQQISLGNRVLAFLRPGRFLSFFVQPQNED